MDAPIPAHDIADLVRQYFAAYHLISRGEVEKLLSDDFTFTSPYDDHIGKGAYFERVWPNSRRIRDHHLVILLADGDEAFVLYECELMSGPRFRNTGYFRCEAGRIRSIEVYFGSLPAAAMKNATEAGGKVLGEPMENPGYGQ